MSINLNLRNIFSNKYCIFCQGGGFVPNEPADANFQDVGNEKEPCVSTGFQLRACWNDRAGRRMAERRVGMTNGSGNGRARSPPKIPIKIIWIS
ncbi:MAG: hypothetical protein NTU73_02285 [Ignavibacteriae bacterium]|nr:hypothetical protein [Ignavibacteriota bacterium]